MANLHAKFDFGAGAQIGCFATRIGYNDTAGTVDGITYTNIMTIYSAIAQCIFAAPNPTLKIEVPVSLTAMVWTQR